MKFPIILLICICVVPSLAHDSNSSESSEETDHKTETQSKTDKLINDHELSELIDHYEQIDLAPFVPTEKAKKKARQAIVLTMAALIHKDRQKDAETLFERIQDPELIREVMRAAYDKTLMNTMRIIDFLKLLNRKADKMRGYSELYDTIKRLKDLKNPAIFAVAYWLKHHLEEADVELETDEYPERFLYYDIEPYSIVSEAVNLLAEDLSGADSRIIMRLAQKYPGATAAIMPRLMREIYGGDLKNFNTIMGFAKTEGLSDAHKEAVLDTLATLMYENNHVKTEQFRKLKEYVNSSESMTTLKKKLVNMENNTN